MRRVRTSLTQPGWGQDGGPRRLEASQIDFILPDGAFLRGRNATFDVLSKFSPASDHCVLQLLMDRLQDKVDLPVVPKRKEKSRPTLAKAREPKWAAKVRLAAEEAAQKELARLDGAGRRGR